MTEKEKILFEKYKKLPVEITPSRDLWNGIEERINDKRNRKLNIKDIFDNIIDMIFFNKKLVLGYSLLILIIIGLSLFTLHTRYYNHKNNFNNQYVKALKQVEETAKEYNKAKANLEKLIMKNENILDPETVNIIKNNLATIDNAVNEIKMALKKDPNNPMLLASLSKFYYEETDLIIKTHDILMNASN